MELRVLKYFLAVARHRNITRTAEDLHLTQPTLSRQLQRDPSTTATASSSRQISMSRRTPRRAASRPSLSAARSAPSRSRHPASTRRG